MIKKNKIMVYLLLAAGKYSSAYKAERFWTSSDIHTCYTREAFKHWPASHKEWEFQDICYFNN